MSRDRGCDLTVAGVQMHSRPGDEEANLIAAATWTARAVEQGAHLVVFPELFVSGYHPEAAAATTRQGTLRALDVLAEEAAAAGTWLVAPLAERAADGRLFNSAAVFDAGGALRTIKRKRALWGWEPQVFEPGADAAPVEMNGVLTGLLLCYEGEFPEPSRALVLAGAELLLLPSAWSDDAAWRWELQPAARALDNLCYVLRVNGVGAGLCGRTALLGPDGRVRRALGGAEEGLVTGVVERTELERWRSELPYLNDLRAAAAGSPATGGE
ncbi:MAG: carbon-nitrogen hydrolase family protein [Deinococcales bacterium]